MSPKNLNVTSKTHKLLLNKLKDKKIYQIYKKFENSLNLNEDFIVAVSGGPDSLALSFLAKIYSIKKSVNIKFFIIDHKLREGSTSEAKHVQKKLKKFSINLNILNWKGKKPKNNIQSVARDKRYKLLSNTAKKLKLKNILVGHHLDDLFENFFIRMIRGSGLKGLVSLGKKYTNNKINYLRPLLDFKKRDLEKLSLKVFNTFIKDPSNTDENFTRIRIRKLLKNLQKEGLDDKKLNLTIQNLKKSNNALEYYAKKNIEDNLTFQVNKKKAFLSKDFLNQPNEVIIRSLNIILKIIGGQYYPPRGKKIDFLINELKLNKNFKKGTLGGCLFKKINETIIISKERG